MDVRLPDGTIIQNVPDNITRQELNDKLKANNISFDAPQQPTEPQPRQLADGEGSDFTRGIGTYYDQIGGIFGGTKVLAGKAFGSEDLIESGLESMEESDAAIGRRGTKETDSFTKAIDKGAISFLTEYIPFVAGQGVGMISEAVVTSIAGGLLGSAVGPGGTVGGGLGGFVGKGLVKKKIKQEAERIAREQGKDASELYLETAAKEEFKDLMKDPLLRSQVNKKIGQTLALGGMAAKFGTGEVTGRAVDEAIKDITDPQEQLEAIQKLNTGRLAGLSAAHALADYIGIKIGLGALEKLAEPTRNMLFNIAKKIGTTGSQEAVVEAVQTGIERFGAYLPLADKEAMEEYINAAAAGFFMPIVPSAISGITSPKRRTAEELIKEQELDKEEKSRVLKEDKRKLQGKLPGSKKNKQDIEEEQKVIEEQEKEVLETTKKEGLDIVPIKRKLSKKQKDATKKFNAIAKKEKQKVANKKIKAEKVIKEKIEVVKKAKTVEAKAKAEDSVVEAVENLEKVNIEVKEVEAKWEEPRAISSVIPYKYGENQPIGEGLEVTEGQQEELSGKEEELKELRKYKDSINARIEDKKNQKLDIEEDQKVLKTIEAEIKNYDKNQGKKGVQQLIERIQTPRQSSLEGFETPQERNRLATEKNEFDSEADVTEAQRLVNQVIDNKGIETVVVDEIGTDAQAQKEIRNKQIEGGFTESHIIEKVLRSNPTEVDGELVSETAVYYLKPRTKIKNLDSKKGVTVNVNAIAKHLIEESDLNLMGSKKKGSSTNPAVVKQWLKDNVTAEQFEEIESLTKNIFSRINNKFKSTSAGTEAQKDETQMGSAFADALIETAQEDTTSPKKKNKKDKKPLTVSTQSREFIEESKTEKTIGNLLKDFNKKLKNISKAIVNPMQEALLEAFENIESLGNTKFSVVKSIPGQARATGSYDTKENRIRITQDATIEDIFHEITHAATANEVRRQVDAEGKGITTAGKRLVSIFNATKRAATNEGTEGTYEQALSNIDEFITYALTNRDFQKFLADTPTTLTTKKGAKKDKSLWSSFIDSVKDLLGLGDISNTLLNDVLVVAPAFLKGPNAAAQKKRDNETLFKKASPPKPLDDVAKKLQPKEIVPVKKAIKEGFMGIFNPAGYQDTLLKIRKQFQNSQAYIEDFEDKNRSANLFIGGLKEGFNNIFEHITVAKGKVDVIIKEVIVPQLQKLNNAVAIYEQEAEKAGIKDSKGRLQVFLTSLHDSERRAILFILGVPLSIKQNIMFNGKKESPNGVRTKLMDILQNKNLNLTEKQIENIRGQLDALTSNKNYQDALKGYDYRGEKTVAKENATPKQLKALTNPNSGRYNPSEFNRDAVDMYLKDYNNYKKTNPSLFKAMEAVQKELQAAADMSLEINRKSNFVNKTSDNLIKFYDFKNYIPLKRDSGQRKLISRFKIGDSLNRVSGELSESDGPMTGQRGTSSNVYEQVIEDAISAAGRVGRDNITQAVKNAVTFKWPIVTTNKDGKEVKSKKTLLDGKVQNISSKERYQKPEIMQQATRNMTNKIINYNADGSVDIITINNREMVEGIKNTYADVNPAIQLLGRTTSFLGQLHTRFNVAFAPLNFLRDSITNAAIISAEMGPAAAADFTNRVAAQVYKGGLAKTYKIAKKFTATKDIKGIRDYVAAQLKKGDTYPRDMWDFLTEGGMVSYRQALSNLEQDQEIREEMMTGGIKKTKRAIYGFFDGYMSTFELSARVAAYQVKLENVLSEKAIGKSRAEIEKSDPELMIEAKLTATAFSKNLANFEQIGLSGRTLGSYFMFFRPSATGAVRGLKAVAPLFVRDFNSFAESLPDSIKNNPQALANYKKDFERRREGAKSTVQAMIGIGMAMPIMSAIISGEDDEGRNRTDHDDASRWTRYARFHIGDGKTVQIPWGFGIGGFAAAGSQLTYLLTGLGDSTKENQPSKIIGNILNIGLDSFLPLPISRMNPLDNFPAWMIDSAMPSAGRPFVEYVMNINAFGSPIYSQRAATRYGDAYSGTSNVPQGYKDATVALAEATNGAINIQPNSLYFFGSNYLDGIARLVANTYGGTQTLLGNKSFDAKRDLLFFESFLSKYSEVDQRAYSRVIKESKDVIERLNLFKNTNPEEYLEYLMSNPIAPVIEKRYNSLIGGEIKKVTTAIKEFKAMPGLTAKEKEEVIELLKSQQIALKRSAAFELDLYLKGEFYD